MEKETHADETIVKWKREKSEADVIANRRLSRRKQEVVGCSGSPAATERTISLSPPIATDTYANSVSSMRFLLRARAANQPHDCLAN